MIDKQNTWDFSLQIKTTGRDELGADEYHHPYEPTPYSVLERLSSSGLIGKDDVVLDYGCGKGRVGFFLSYRRSTKAIGIEYDERIYESALENQKTAKTSKNIWSVNPGGPGTAGFADRTEQSVSDSSSARSAKYADIAQLLEQRPFKAWVGGSNPSVRTK